MVFIQCSPKCSASCLRYMLTLDPYLVHRFQKHKLPAVAAALMWLSLLCPIDDPPLHMRLEGYLLIAREAQWLWKVRRSMDNKNQFLYYFMRFLSNHERSGNLFVGSAISTAHFAQVCAERAWRGILVLDHQFMSENWGYVHSTIPNALLDNILDRLLVYFNDVMNLIIGVPYARSSAVDIIQHTKVSQTPISFSLGPLNHIIFILRTKMRVDDMSDLVKFVEASVAEDQKESFESQLLRWRNTKTEATAPMGSTMVRSPFIFCVACVKFCSIDISISGTI